jgi:hypothetical protein
MGAGMHAAYRGGCTHARRICKHARTHVHIPIGYSASLCVYIHNLYINIKRISPPSFPLPLAATSAPEDVEHPVGRRRKAYVVARGGAGAGGRQRCPGVGRRAEAVQVVEVVYVCVCVCVYVYLSCL